MTPSQLLVDRFGGLTPVAQTLGLQPSAVSHWLKTGRVPKKHHSTLIAAAAQKGIALARSDLTGDPESPQQPELINAVYAGDLKLGADETTAVRCYVLEDGRRVISRSTAVKTISGKEGGNLEGHVRPLGVAMQHRLDDELISFRIPEVKASEVKGVRAEFFLEILQAYVNWRDSGDVLTDAQVESCKRAAAFLSACATVGLIALIDEATGYQYDRAEDALQTKLALYLEEAMRPWEKTFPDELWHEFGRLTGWDDPLSNRPKYWGKLVNELIYEPLDPDVAEWLQNNAPSPRHGRNYHQWLSAQFGLKKLVEHIWMVIGVARACATMNDLRYRIAEMHGKVPLQRMLFIDPPGPTPGSDR